MERTAFARKNPMKQIRLSKGIKEVIYQVRNDSTAKDILLQNSQFYFIVANQTVFLAQDYVTKQITQSTFMISLLFCGM